MFSEIWQFFVDNIFAALLVLILFSLIVGLVFWKYSLTEIRQVRFLIFNNCVILIPNS
ncbi:unnamed protein product [Meloidogyne enterolobii]|uniref:Uncharacterized protein n=1 Tax=Meloidogyne enterolobii TaxID=390850 RepID=A0ACB0YK71_MELEN